MGEVAVDCLLTTAPCRSSIEMAVRSIPTLEVPNPAHIQMCQRLVLVLPCCHLEFK